MTERTISSERALKREIEEKTYKEGSCIWGERKPSERGLKKTSRGVPSPMKHESIGKGGGRGEGLWEKATKMDTIH